MGKIITTRLFPHSTQAVQVQDTERGNEKDAECGEKAERIPTPECTRVENVNSNGCEPEFSRDTCDKKEVLPGLTLSSFLKG